MSMALSEKDQLYYRNNVKAMLSLLTDSDRNSVGIFFASLMMTFTIVVSSIIGMHWFLWVFVMINAISILGIRDKLKNICNPFTVTQYKNKMDMDDDNFKKSYAILKRTPFIKSFQVMSYSLEVYMIIFVAGMLPLGLICLLMYVYLENSIHNNNVRMRYLWNEQLEVE